MALGLAVHDEFSARVNLRSRRTWTRVAMVCVLVTAFALLRGGWFSVQYLGGR
jgi:hypothetical protein